MRISSITTWPTQSRRRGTSGGVTDSPILIDKFLDSAIECDVDCVADFDPSGKE